MVIQVVNDGTDTQLWSAIFKGLKWSEVKVTKLCLTLWDPMDCSPWNSPGQNTGVGSLSLLQGSSQPRDQTQVSHIAGRFFTSWATREAREYWSGQPIPSLVDLPVPGIEPGSPSLQADSLPTELSGVPWVFIVHCALSTLTFTSSALSILFL